MPVFPVRGAPGIAGGIDGGRIAAPGPAAKPCGRTLPDDGVPMPNTGGSDGVFDDDPGVAPFICDEGLRADAPGIALFICDDGMRADGPGIAGAFICDEGDRADAPGIAGALVCADGPRAEVPGIAAAFICADGFCGSEPPDVAAPVGTPGIANALLSVSVAANALAACDGAMRAGEFPAGANGIVPARNGVFVGAEGGAFGA
jgi:hypothetical protein